MARDEAVALAAERLRLANDPAPAGDVVARLAVQLADLLDGLSALDRRLPPEAEPATVERVDAPDE
jgi:hypothetical protein